MSILDIMSITNYDLFGYLIQSYALGQDLVNQPPLAKDNGRYQGTVGTITLAKFVQDMKDAGVVATMPTRYTSVQFVQGSNTNLVIKLPEAAPLQTTLSNLGSPTFPWVLPSFYTDKNGFKATNAPASMPTAQLQTLFADRIGDYTVSVCL